MNSGKKFVETGVKIGQQVYNSIPEKVKADLIGEFTKIPLEMGKEAYGKTVNEMLINPNRSDKSKKEVDQKGKTNSLFKVGKESKFDIPEMKNPLDVARKIYGIDKNKLLEGIKEARQIQANSKKNPFIFENYKQKQIDLTKKS